MRNPGTSFLALLSAAREGGIVPRTMIYITAKDRETGTFSPFGLWTGDDDITVEVISGATGLPETRTYFGMGKTLIVPSIPLVADLTIQAITVEMSQLSAVTQEIVRGYDVRLAPVDMHQCLYDPTTRLPVEPELVFIGEVDGSSTETPAAGGEGSITLEIVSSAIRALTRTNPRKRSHEAQKRRDGDEFGRYSNSVASWEVLWGESAASGTSNTGDSKKSGEMGGSRDRK